MTDKKILIIDIETTGFHPRNSIITEIGIVELDLESGKTKILFDSVCHCKRDFLTKEYIEKSWIVSKGYMTVDEIKHSTDIRLLLPEIQSIIDKYPNGATAYNRPFDITFLDYYGVKFGKLLPCPMIISIPIVKAKFKTKSRGGQSYKYPSVEESWKHYFPEIPYVEKHRGADDAMHEAQIVHKLYTLKHFKL